MTTLRPKKSLGQHFLTDPNIIRNIVGLLDPQPGDTVVEIGPGEGALTGLLADSGARVIAVDVDRRAVSHLERTLDTRENVSVRHGDILTLDLTALSREVAAPLRVIGNLPYNITSQILFHVFAHRRAVHDCVLMMQREVALRLVSAPKSKDYGILAVMTQLNTRVEHAFRVSPNVFTPRPAVWSSVVRMVMRHDDDGRPRDEEFFRAFVRAAFGKRRKVMSNSIKDLGIDPHALPAAFAEVMRLRPEQLSIPELVALSDALQPFRLPSPDSQPERHP
ncbi:MAG: ribosomal RNA small subunit methyltransferase A [Ignavibacteria bacterium]|nr:ribosomal RNA small subunit methyltransferase A [Ignavibacteria bacterium]